MGEPKIILIFCTAFLASSYIISCDFSVQMYSNGIPNLHYSFLDQDILVLESQKAPYSYFYSLSTPFTLEKTSVHKIWAKPGERENVRGRLMLVFALGIYWHHRIRSIRTGTNEHYWNWDNFLQNKFGLSNMVLEMRARGRTGGVQTPRSWNNQTETWTRPGSVTLPSLCAHSLPDY
ncbi:hypothetical protein P167DRAFT_541440 [Morchella conica CCBAS932]|uniref:Uncharacterized protein n=1 Tax=Morchella conica CCBAS932 TaxID=1392247 RepID=A0A3N4L3J8_9PEZI|nr:hypothetical protein P167DRAFT_541440 [Morchella conica CCBAS932]